MFAMKIKQHLSLIALAVVLTLCGVALPSHADNSSIPSSLYSTRDQLLQQKHDLLDRRDRIMQDLREWDYTLKQADDSLRGDIQNRQEILYWRDKLVTDIRYAEGQKWDIERALLTNNDDLRRVESEMDRFASYTSNYDAR